LIRLPQQTHVRVARFDGLAAASLPSAADLARRIAGDFSRRLASPDK
jgi:hypothetical protein